MVYDTHSGTDCADPGMTVRDLSDEIRRDVLLLLCDRYPHAVMHAIGAVLAVSPAAEDPR
jgi:hypothetical protein